MRAVRTMVAYAIIVLTIIIAMTEPASNPSDSPPAAVEFYRASSYRPELSVGLLMRRALHSIVQQVDRRLIEQDLTHAQWVPLYKLMHGECTTLVALARDLQADPGATTRVLDRLAAKGLVQRERSTADRRVVRLALTDAGRRVAETVPPVLAEVLNAHLAGFTEDEWQLLIQLLQRLLANGEALREGAAACGSASTAGPAGAHP